MRNPFADRMKLLGIAAGAYNAARAQAEALLRARDSEEQIAEAEIRAAIIPAVSDRVWNEIKKEIGLT